VSNNDSPTPAVHGYYFARERRMNYHHRYTRNVIVAARTTDDAGSGAAPVQKSEEARGVRRDSVWKRRPQKIGTPLPCS